MNWKKILLIGLGWGVGTTVTLTVLLGGIFWYTSRPKPPVPPKPWNVSAIKAEYDFASTDADKNNIIFYYTLENTTDFDYRVEDSQHVTITAKLEEENSLTSFLKSEGVLDYPIFVPAKKRVRFVVHLIGYTYSVKAKDNATDEERRQRRSEVAKYVADKFANLDGFDLLDAETRYEIILPGGWKQSKK